MTFQVGREMLICPTDNVACVIVGTADFAYRCPMCGSQYRSDGTPLTIGVAQAPALVVRPNDASDQDPIVADFGK